MTPEWTWKENFFLRLSSEYEKRKIEEVEELPYSFRNITLNILLCFPDRAPALIVLIMRTSEAWLSQQMLQMPFKMQLHVAINVEYALVLSYLLCHSSTGLAALTTLVSGAIPEPLYKNQSKRVHQSANYNVFLGKLNLSEISHSPATVLYKGLMLRIQWYLN